MELDKVFVDDVEVGSRLRPLDEEKVESLVESMRALGLMQPISVWTPNNERVYLVAGRHRLEAAKRLGWDQIDCFFVHLSEIDRELWEIDENLMRAELTPAQVAAHLARRKELWEARKSDENFATFTGRGNEGFAQDTAKKTGVHKSTVNKAIARATTLGDAINEITGTSLDKGVELDALAKLPEEERQDLIRRARSGEQVSARKPVPPPADPLNDFETVDKQVSALMTAWNRAGPEARRRFLEMIDAPVMG